MCRAFVARKLQCALTRWINSGALTVDAREPFLRSMEVSQPEVRAREIRCIADCTCTKRRDRCAATESAFFHTRNGIILCNIVI